MQERRGQRAFAYLRLSNEEAKSGESESITNQRLLLRRYCAREGITLVREFVDDGYSGGNFARPAFQQLLEAIEQDAVDLVLTKDLSRLGRDMREASYYAEQYLPERGIRYIAINDNFDTAQDNVMAPFQFAMNEVYLRDGSRKVREVLRGKRENGQYCACPPYGYRKNPKDRNHLLPDENTAPVVAQIFELAGQGRSARQIAQLLTAEGIPTPLAYRLQRDQYEKQVTASAQWSYTTVKRILKNRVYLGETILGKSRKVSVKSKKKIAVPKQGWVVHQNTHPAIVSEQAFSRAHQNMGKGYAPQSSGQVRKSIFGGIAFCGLCGHALCSGGTVYKGERNRYWYLICTHKRTDVAKPCKGVRIRYADLVSVVTEELNELISMSDEQIDRLVREVLRGRETQSAQARQRARLSQRLATLDQMTEKLYADFAEGRLSDAQLSRMTERLGQQSAAIEQRLAAMPKEERGQDEAVQYQKFFALARQFTPPITLDRTILTTFIERIEVFEKKTVVDKQGEPQIRQNIRIFYKFIGERAGEKGG